jgi:hypothetical protein
MHVLVKKLFNIEGGLYNQMAKNLNESEDSVREKYCSLKFENPHNSSGNISYVALK